MASGSDDNTIGVWRVSSGERIITLTSHSNQAKNVVFSPNGVYLASGSADNTIRKRLKHITGHSSRVTSVVFSPNGEYLASRFYDRTIKVWRFFN